MKTKRLFTLYEWTAPLKSSYIARIRFFISFRFCTLGEKQDEEMGTTTKDNADRKPRPKSVPISVEGTDGKNQPVLTSYEMKALT